jgi:hypothetical protein
MGLRRQMHKPEQASNTVSMTQYIQILDLWLLIANMVRFPGYSQDGIFTLPRLLNFMIINHINVCSPVI